MSKSSTTVDIFSQMRQQAEQIGKTAQNDNKSKVVEPRDNKDKDVKAKEKTEERKPVPEKNKHSTKNAAKKEIGVEPSATDKPSIPTDNASIINAFFPLIKSGKKSVHMNILLTENVKEKIDRIADATGLSKNEIINQILEKYEI